MTMLHQVVSAATTTIGEMRRGDQKQAEAAPQSFTQLSMAELRVKNVDKVRKVVQLNDWFTGVDFAGGQWVPLAHTVLDILGDHGTVRKGMSALVFYLGQAGSPVAAYAIIVGEENEAGPSKDNVPNTISRAFHSILMEPV